MSMKPKVFLCLHVSCAQSAFEFLMNRFTISLMNLKVFSAWISRLILIDHSMSNKYSLNSKEISLSVINVFFSSCHSSFFISKQTICRAEKEKETEEKKRINIRLFFVSFTSFFLIVRKCVSASMTFIKISFCLRIHQRNSVLVGRRRTQKSVYIYIYISHRCERIIVLIPKYFGSFLAFPP
jgi:hypothetical protein